MLEARAIMETMFPAPREKWADQWAKQERAGSPALIEPAQRAARVATDKPEAPDGLPKRGSTDEP